MAKKFRGAQLLEVTQPYISKLERQQDLLVSKLYDYVATLGGQVEIRAKFPTTMSSFGNSMNLPRSCRSKIAGQFLVPGRLAPERLA